MNGYDTKSPQLKSEALPSSFDMHSKESHEDGQGGTKKRTWFGKKKDKTEEVQDKAREHLEKQYNGGKRWNGKYWYRRPTKDVDQKDLERLFQGAGMIEKGDDGKFGYMNALGQTYNKYQDVDVYLSTTNLVPRRLMVQATKYVRENKPATDWRRTNLEGDIPTALKLAEWALSPGDRDKNGRRRALGMISSCFRTLVVGLPLQMLLAFPGANAPWEEDNVEDAYIDYPGFHWRWAKHAINPLDQRPTAEHKSKPKKLSSVTRLIRPRQLVVYRDGAWYLDKKPKTDIPYVFISYANMHFNTNNSEEGRQLIFRMAEHVTLKAGCKAYWLDFICRANGNPELLTADVNRMCDVIRGARRVVVMIPESQGKYQDRSRESFMEEWGRRMWTLPEGLLANGQLHFCSPLGDTFEESTLRKVELTGNIWKDGDEYEDESPTRLLAEHFSGTVTLSRLDLFSTALAALGSREPENLFTDADLAYALMGLLHYRIEPDPTDSLFQAIARLSLANDNDRLIERMVCMYPQPGQNVRHLFRNVSVPDQFGTHLWDINPLCQVVGVGEEPNTILLNNCRAIPIRWKKFPRMQYKRHQGFKKWLAELFVRSGAWWMVTGASLAWTYAPLFLANTNSTGNYSSNLSIYMIALVGGFLTIGIILSCFGPRSVRRLFGGSVQQTTPHLIGFEGVMPIDELEKIVFGNSNGRLSYEPSSTPFCRRDPDIRQGLEPDFVSNPSLLPGMEAGLPKNQRLFTLVDTGQLTVSIFAASKPPTVALICGSEGGMLRAVLCSWRFSIDCLFREAVIRMEHDTWEQARTKSWLKLSLGTQEDMAEAIVWQRKELWKERESGQKQTPRMQVQSPQMQSPPMKSPPMQDPPMKSPPMKSPQMQNSSPTQSSPPMQNPFKTPQPMHEQMGAPSPMQTPQASHTHIASPLPSPLPSPGIKQDSKTSYSQTQASTQQTSTQRTQRQQQQQHISHQLNPSITSSVPPTTTSELPQPEPQSQHLQNNLISPLPPSLSPLIQTSPLQSPQTWATPQQSPVPPLQNLTEQAPSSSSQQQQRASMPPPPPPPQQQQPQPQQSNPLLASWEPRDRRSRYTAQPQQSQQQPQQQQQQQQATESPVQSVELPSTPVSRPASPNRF